MNIYCLQHGRSIGVVRLAPGGFPSFQTRTPRWRDHLARRVGFQGRDNAFLNLRETTREEVEAWCRDCGSRMISREALLVAFQGGEPKISL